jgi:hypothetical protein
LHEEEQHIDIREKLLKLPKVKASDDFLNALQRKINLADAELNQKKITEDVKESIWVKLFGKKRNPWLIPSLSLTIVVIFIISIYVLNSGKVSEIPTMSDFQKKETSTGKTPDDKEVLKDTKEKSTNQDITNNFKFETDKKDFKAPSVLDKKLTETPSPVTIPAPMERKVDEISRPSNSEPVKNESGKVEYKKEEKIYQDMEKNHKDESNMSKEGNTGIEEQIKKVAPKEKNDVKDAIETKGLIDKKEKMTMKKSAKSTVDSTKINQQVLEKIKEELEKTIDEK